MYTLVTGVRGAVRTSTYEYEDLDAARAAALRWSRSNSTGHYWAQVLAPTGTVVARYNLAPRAALGGANPHTLDVARAQLDREARS